MLTKLFKGEEPVIQKLSENHMLGSRQSISAINRNLTGFDIEQDYSKIFKEINAKATYEVYDKLDVLDKESIKDKHKKYNIISTDALNIKKR